MLVFYLGSVCLDVWGLVLPEIRYQGSAFFWGRRRGLAQVNRGNQKSQH